MTVLPSSAPPRSDLSKHGDCKHCHSFPWRLRSSTYLVDMKAYYDIDWFRVITASPLSRVCFPS